MKKKILIVDDEKLLRDSLLEFLKDELYEIESVTNGREAIDFLNGQKIDLLMTDIIMPEMEGMELIRIVRRKFPNLPIIVMSGNTMGYDYLEAAQLLGAKESIRKPIDLENIKKTVMKYMID